MKISIIICVALLVYFLIKAEFLLAGFAVVLGMVFILCSMIIKRTKINNIKEKIKDAEENLRSNKEIVPFINVNKDAYYILELIPGVKRVYALKIANDVKRNKKISSFEEFANVTSLSLADYPLVKKILKF